MKTLSPNDALDLEMERLQLLRNEELIALKLQFKEVHESLKPINLIKDAFRSVVHAPDVKEGIDKTALGLVSGFLVKNIIFRKSINPIKILARVALQTVASSLAIQNSDKMKSTGNNILGAILSKFSKKEKTPPPTSMQLEQHIPFK